MDSKATVGWPIPPTAPSAGCPDVVQPATVRPPAVIASATRAALSTTKHPAAPPRYVPRNIANPCPATAPIMASRNVPHCMEGYRENALRSRRSAAGARLRMMGATPAAGPIGASARLCALAIRTFTPLFGGDGEVGICTLLAQSPGEG